MEKTIAERLIKLAEMLNQKAEEIRMKTQGVDRNGNPGINQEAGE